MPWSQGRHEEAGRLWKESWELEEQDVQLPRPLSATESREAWSWVSSSVEMEGVKVEARVAYPRADEELQKIKDNNTQVKQMLNISFDSCLVS